MKKSSFNTSLLARDILAVILLPFTAGMKFLGTYGAQVKTIALFLGSYVAAYFAIQTPTFAMAFGMGNNVAQSIEIAYLATMIAFIALNVFWLWKSSTVVSSYNRFDTLDELQYLASKYPDSKFSWKFAKNHSIEIYGTFKVNGQITELLLSKSSLFAWHRENQSFAEALSKPAKTEYSNRDDNRQRDDNRPNNQNNSGQRNDNNRNDWKNKQGNQGNNQNHSGKPNHQPAKQEQRDTESVV